ncbi:MAG: D-alanyl-D-alanine carboxypeptidase family protein [Rhodospirillaceae bacterium]
MGFSSGENSFISAAQAFETKAKHALLVDFDTGTVLLDKDGAVQMPPSSMSKLMTAYMVFERLRAGAIAPEDEFSVSDNAWRKGGAASGGSTMFLEPRTTAKVEDLLRGIIIQSGNDACIVIAENLNGNEAAFAEAMNRQAAELGLDDSNFTNATGLPDPNHFMTARDLAKLARHIIVDFPEYYSLYSETEFAYNGITQHNRNPLLYKSVGADGLKTGHTSIAGYGLTASAKQGDRRLILVINGLESTRARSEEAERLMSWGFRNFQNVELLTQGAVISEAEVWMGDQDLVALSSPESVTVTLPNTAHRDMVVKVVYDGPIQAPITKGQEIARLTVDAPDIEPMSFPLVAAADVDRLNIVGRLAAAAKHALFGLADIDLDQSAGGSASQ